MNYTSQSSTANSLQGIQCSSKPGKILTGLQYNPPAQMTVNGLKYTANLKSHQWKSEIMLPFFDVAELAVEIH
jgi:hypothetical protein